MLRFVDSDFEVASFILDGMPAHSGTVQGVGGNEDTGRGLNWRLAWV